MAKKYTDADEVLVKLGHRMQELRKERGFKNRDHFAYMHEINRVQYGRYEKGGDIRFSTLLRILDAFDITLEDFFAEGFE